MAEVEFSESQQFVRSTAREFRAECAVAFLQPLAMLVIFPTGKALKFFVGFLLLVSKEDEESSAVSAFAPHWCSNAGSRRRHEDGLLPAGIRKATWSEFADRFGGSARRRELLEGLKQALKSLRAAGCR